MTCREKLAIEHPDKIKPDHSGGCEGCPHHYGYLNPDPEFCNPERYNCVKCWDREIPENKTVNTMEQDYPCNNCDMGWGSIGSEGSTSCHESCERLHRYFDRKTCGEIREDLRNTLTEINPEPHIKDSGDRTQFASGAVRDMRAGKGRCDLMPLEVVANYICDDNESTDSILWSLNMFLKTNSAAYLYSALNDFDALVYADSYTMFLEVAKHYEEGAKKYGENNWQKGMPTWCYIDSAIRHYLKWCRGDIDEPHDRAFVWNLLCCIWEVNHRDKKEETK